MCGLSGDLERNIVWGVALDFDGGRVGVVEVF